MSRNDVDEVKALLCARIGELVAELCPEGKRAGAYWQFRSNAHDHKIGGAWVRIGSHKTGGWCDEVTGETGDIFMLIARRVGTGSFGETMTWARGWLGLETMSRAERDRRVAAARVVPADAPRPERDQKRALAMFIRSKQITFTATPAHRYLLGRGIDVTRLGRMPGSLGWLPAYQRTDGTPAFGCMLAGFTGADGQMVAVHRTFLTDDGEKAPVDPVRRIWPAFGGAAIRLWRGESKLDVKEAAANGLREALVLVEGVEDGLSVALARPELRVWAAGSLGNLGAIQLPECCDAVIVCADNDWGKAQAGKQLDKAIDALVRQGRAVSIARSLIGKDMNDALRAEIRRP